MKYKLSAQNLSEWFAIKTNQIPKPLVDTFINNIQSYCIQASVQVGIFAKLVNHNLSTEQLAEACKIDKDFLAFVLPILVQSDYLVCRKGIYRLPRKLKKFFTSSGEHCIENNLLLNHSQLQILSNLDAALRTGRAVDIHKTFKSSSYWQVYQAAMLEIARANSKAIARRMVVNKPAELLLDIGGAHGLLGAAICRKHGISKSIVLDLSQAIAAAKPLAVAEGIDDIVDFQPFDVLEQPIPYEADVIFMANFLHHFNQQQVESILAKAKMALKPGGTIAILDFSTDHNTEKNLTIALVSLFFKLTSNSKLYSSQDYAEFLLQAGFVNTKISRFIKMPATKLVLARNL